MERLFFIHSNLYLAAFLIVAALVEILCGINVDSLTAIWIAYPAAGLFSIIALCIIWSVILWERKHT